MSYENADDNIMDEGTIQKRHMEIPEWLSTFDVTSESMHQMNRFSQNLFIKLKYDYFSASCRRWKERRT